MQRDIERDTEICRPSSPDASWLLAAGCCYWLVMAAILSYSVYLFLSWSLLPFLSSSLHVLFFSSPLLLFLSSRLLPFSSFALLPLFLSPTLLLRFSCGRLFFLFLPYSVLFWLLKSSFDVFGCLLGSLFGLLGPLLTIFGASWGSFWESFGPLGASWSSLGHLLASSWAPEASRSGQS